MKEVLKGKHWGRRGAEGPGSGAAIVFKQEKEKKKKKRNEQKSTGGMDHFWFFSWLESQSRPSYKPSPLVAQVAWMYQLR